MALRKLTFKAIPEKPMEGENPGIHQITVEVDEGPMRIVLVKGEYPMDISQHEIMAKRLREKLGPNAMIVSCENGWSVEVLEEVAQ